MVKRILFILHQADRTGAPIALCHIIQLLKKQYDMECDVILLKGGELESEFKKYGNVYHGWIKKNLFTKIGCKLNLKWIKHPYLRIIKKKKYDLVYANTIWSFLVAKHIKEVLHIPLILHLHESSYALSIAGISQEDLLQSDRIITVSEFAAKAIEDTYHYPKDKILISHPFSDLTISLLKRKDIIPKNRKNQTFNIGLAGSGYWIKAIDRLPILIDYFFKKYSNANCHFIWVGEMIGDEEKKLMFELKKLNLLDKLTLIGKVNNPEEYFAQFDVFLLLSREDSFPLVALENAVLCKPIICFDGCSGAVEWIQEGAGDVVPYMQLEEVADEIYKFYSNSEYTKKTGEEARKIVQKLYEEGEANNAIVTLLSNI